MPTAEMPRNPAVGPPMAETDGLHTISVVSVLAIGAVLNLETTLW
jgi:hypothetical protein